MIFGWDNVFIDGKLTIHAYRMKSLWKGLYNIIWVDFSTVFEKHLFDITCM